MEKAKSFVEIYYSLDNTSPRKAFVKKVAKATMKSEQTVRCWLYGFRTPDALAQSTIARLLKVPAKSLFPETH